MAACVCVKEGSLLNDEAIALKVVVSFVTWKPDAGSIDQEFDRVSHGDFAVIAQVYHVGPCELLEAHEAVETC